MNNKIKNTVSTKCTAISNYRYIKNMDISQMAKFFASFGCCEMCAFKNKLQCEEESCSTGIERWLKQKY